VYRRIKNHIPFQVKGRYPRRHPVPVYRKLDRIYPTLSFMTFPTVNPV
jgi:hypothetical protein